VNRILILVLSYDATPYKELMQAQKSSWDSLQVDGVETIYYHGSLLSGDNVDCAITIDEKWRREVQFKCTDSYYLMSHKWKLLLEYIKDWDYQYIFRTNSSSYICKRKLKEFAETLPKEKLYAGWTFTDSEDFGGKCVSGAGIWLSRDTAEILRQEINPDFEMEEDVYCGRILRKHGIKAIDDRSRFDVGYSFSNDIPTNLYHYRFKNADRIKDAENMKKIHLLL
jgi:hypothetical protein